MLISYPATYINKLVATYIDKLAANMLTRNSRIYIKVKMYILNFNHDAVLLSMMSGMQCAMRFANRKKSKALH